MNSRLYRFYYRIVSLVLIVLFLFGQVGHAPAASIIYVKVNAAGANNGASWANAYKNLQVALAAATPGSQLWVAAGTYYPTNGFNRNLYFIIPTGIALYGGFAGNETLLSQRKPAVHLTILSGNIGDPGTSTDNSYHVVYSGGDSTSILDGFKIIGGSAGGSSDFNLHGGGLYVGSGSPTLRNLTFANNNAELGAGMYVSAASPALTNVTFTNNSAHAGGGLYLSNAHPHINHATFTNNSATSAGGLDMQDSSSLSLANASFTNNFGRAGGGLLSSGSTGLTLTNVSFVNNSAFDSGGGALYTANTSLALTNVTFTGNSSRGDGGAMRNSSSSGSLSRVTFTNNSISTSNSISNPSGGAIYNSGSSLTLQDVAFTGNSVTTTDSTSPKGGAIYNTQSSPTLVNVTFSGNKLVGGSGSSPKGGGMFNTVNSSPTLVNVTFSGNSAGGISEGGALYNEAGSNTLLSSVTFSGNTAHFGGALYSQTGTTPAIYNTVFWGDSSEIGLLNSSPTIVDSIIQTGCPFGTVCTNVIAGNPQLGPLQNNGGFTKTMALGPGSAALNAGGQNSTCPGSDQRNVARPQGFLCDMGAYEVRLVSFPSAPAYDGQVLESGKLSNIGGVTNTSAPFFRVGDDALNRRYRGFLSFNTSSLPDTAAVVSSFISIVLDSHAGTPYPTLGTLVADMRSPFFGAGPTLTSTDWQAPATVNAAASFGPTQIADGHYWIANLSPIARPKINRLGLTQFRLRFTTEHYNNLPDYEVFDSDPTLPPQLFIYYNP